MRLLKSLTNLISENRKSFFVVSRDIKNEGRRILLYESFHQKYERSGGLDIFAHENRRIYANMMQGFWKSGLPSVIIKKNVEENFNKIWDESTKYLETCQEDCRILFKSRDSDLENIEYILAMEKLDENTLRLVIVTSYLSYNKDYLRSLKRNDPTVVLSEGTIDFEKIKVVYL